MLTNLKQLIPDILTVAREAGQDILEIYRGDIDVETKADDSPLTAADRAAHNRIVAGLT